MSLKPKPKRLGEVFIKEAGQSCRNRKSPDGGVGLAQPPHMYATLETAEGPNKFIYHLNCSGGHSHDKYRISLVPPSMVGRCCRSGF